METTEQVQVKNGRGKASDASTTSDKPKRQRKMRSLPTIGSADKMKVITRTYQVDSVQSDWGSIPPLSLFSLSEDGSYLCLKDSVSTYIDLQLEKRETEIAQGRGYRLYRL